MDSRCRPCPVLLLLFPLVVLGSCATASIPPADPGPEKLGDLFLDAAEANAALEIISVYASGRQPEGAAWKRLHDTVGYQQLHRREASMNREFSDEAFKTFLQDPATVSKEKRLRATVAAWQN